jgi:hypothetical protein
LKRLTTWNCPSSVNRIYITSGNKAGWSVFPVEEEDVGFKASPARTALGVDLNLLGAKNETGKAEG